MVEGKRQIVSESERPLETPRLVLEPLNVAHAQALYQALQAPELYQFIPGDPPTSRDSLAARYESLATRHSPDGKELWLNWVLRLRETGVYVGTVEVTVYRNRTAYLAYQIFPPFWRQGLARESCVCVLAHLVAHYQVSRVEAEIDTRNVASIHLVERLGFIRVSLTPQADFFKGAYSDEYRYHWSFSSMGSGNLNDGNPLDEAP
jgi:RimJ/RimL family protein N-acetyltransferase